MKRAIGYARISTKDQSHYSIEAQEQAIRSHCAKQGWELIAMNVDDGQSAKNFDRANWKELERFIKKNHKYVDYLVVMKYDRFSRNVSEALAKLDVFENTYKLRVISVNEPIALPPDSPFFFRFRVDMLVHAEMELRILKDRTVGGMRQAARNGRHTHTAPFGYKNARDEQGKPILEVVPEDAELVVQAYDMFLNGITIAEIQRRLQPKGLKRTGNSAMRRLLSNPVYTGLIYVPAYRDEPEEYVESLSPAIVERTTWYRVQAALQGKNKFRTVYNDEVPLRGAVSCHCGRPLTAGNSKGRSRYYWYYKCNTHKEINLKADVLHNQFEAILSHLSLSDREIKYLADILATAVDDRLKAATDKIKALKKKIQETDEHIERLEERYIKGHGALDADTYIKWRGRFFSERNEYEDELAKLNTPVESTWTRYREQLARLNDLNYIYSKCDITQKQHFIKLVFNNKLYYADGSYRTTFIEPMFALKAAPLQAKGLLIVEQPVKNFREIPVGSEDGS